MKIVKVPASSIGVLTKTLSMLEQKADRGGVPPKGAQSAAERGLKLRREFGRGGTRVGIARARDISNGENLSEDTIRRMKAYFDRHEVDKQGKDWDNAERPSNGKIAWLLWGGDAGRSWATRLVERWNREDGRKKGLPRWLPNGDEITEISQLAAVLNVDEKTAAFVVLDSHNPNKKLYENALVELKGRNVRDAEYWGAPVGTPLPLPPKFRKPKKPRKRSTSKPQTREKNRERAEVLKDRAEQLRSEGKQTRAAIYELRSHQARTGIRSYRETKRTVVALPVRGKASVKAKYTPSQATSRILKDGGIDSPSFYELQPSEAEFFQAAIRKSKEDNIHGASVYVYDAEEYKGMRLFISEDGGAGFAIKDGDELVSVFKGDSKAKRVAHPMVHLAIELGVRRGDAFDTVLPHIYGDHGLQTVARVKWDDDYSPPGWDKSLFKDFNDGEPDVIFMAYSPDDSIGYINGIGKYEGDYDSAYDYAKEISSRNLIKTEIDRGRIKPYSSKDVYAGDRSGGVSGAVAAPFEIMKVPVQRRKRIRKQTRDRISRMLENWNKHQNRKEDEK